MKEVVNFVLKGEGFSRDSGEKAGPEGCKGGAEGGRRRGVRGKVAFQPRVDVRVMDHGGQADVELSLVDDLRERRVLMAV